MAHQSFCCGQGEGHAELRVLNDMESEPPAVRLYSMNVLGTGLASLECTHQARGAARLNRPVPLAIRLP